MERMSAKAYNKKYGTIFKTQKTNKYNAKKSVVDGKQFDSTSEGEYYYELKLQERQGLIQAVETQVKESFYWNEVFICNYYVDFLVTHNDGMLEYIEHKGIATPAWRIKWKLLQAKHANNKNVKCTVNWYKKKFNYNKLK